MGLVQSTVTNDFGRYRIERLPRGMYTLTAAIQGFKTTTREGLELSIGGEVKVNFNLEIGKLEENITVIGVSPLVETTRAQVSTVITEKEFLSYPQGNRDYTSLIAYAPGTLPGAGRSGYAVNGMRGSSNNFQIDGIDNNDNGTATNAVTSMPPESIQEFRLVSNNFSAEYGRNSGGVINAVMKSGTNEFHGSAWIFHRGGSALFQSEDWLTHDLPPYKRYQYGGTIGGPIIKDKTFFFASYRGRHPGRRGPDAETVLHAGSHRAGLGTGQDVLRQVRLHLSQADIRFRRHRRRRPGRRGQVCLGRDDQDERLQLRPEDRSHLFRKGPYSRPLALQYLYFRVRFPAGPRFRQEESLFLSHRWI